MHFAHMTYRFSLYLDMSLQIGSPKNFVWMFDFFPFFKSDPNLLKWLFLCSHPFFSFSGLCSCYVMLHIVIINFSFSGVQEENKKLEVLLFEYETAIASLGEELDAANREKDEVIFRNEGITSKLEALSEELNTSNKELQVFQEEVSALVSFCISPYISQVLGIYFSDVDCD